MAPIGRLATPLLDVAGVAAAYGSFTALESIDLIVRAGEAVAVIGPNGAGKTTLLRAVSKLVPLAKGEIRIDGRSIAQLPAHRLIELGLAHVPEHRRLFPRLTVEENLKMGAFTPAARARFAESLAHVYALFPRLAERRAQAAGTMSGGEQQMCAIGRGLMSRPRLLMLDEPSAGLAPVIVQQLLDLVRRLKGEGYTVLIVEQNVRQVLEIVDRAYLLEAGRIRGAGPAAELLASDLVRKAYLGL
jgi:branched-chain amino acid transport system ATP-binding protein